MQHVRTMYDAATPPARFHPGQPWAGYLHSVHPYAVWPVEALREAVRVCGLLPIWGAPLDAAAYDSARPADEARAAIAQTEAIGGGRLVIAVDTEQRAWEASPHGSQTYALAFAHTVAAAGGVTVFYGSGGFLAAMAPHGVGTPWLADYTTARGWPVPGWRAGGRGWQYAGDVSRHGKNVDLSRIEDRFPLITADTSTPLSVRARHAGRVLDRHLAARTHPVRAGDDRQLLHQLDRRLTRALDRTSST